MIDYKSEDLTEDAINDAFKFFTDNDGQIDIKKYCMAMSGSAHNVRELFDGMKKIGIGLAILHRKLNALEEKASAPEKNFTVLVEGLCDSIQKLEQKVEMLEGKSKQQA